MIRPVCLIRSTHLTFYFLPFYFLHDSGIDLVTAM